MSDIQEFLRRQHEKIKRVRKAGRQMGGFAADRVTERATARIRKARNRERKDEREQ